MKMVTFLKKARTRLNPPPPPPSASTKQAFRFLPFNGVSFYVSNYKMYFASTVIPVGDGIHASNGGSAHRATHTIHS